MNSSKQRTRKNRFYLWTGGLALVLAGAGCGTNQPPPTRPNFNQDIAGLLQQHCTTCHAPGGPAPTRLSDYASAYEQRDRILDRVARGHMPPWLPAQEDIALIGARALGAPEKQLLHDWVQAGAPEGPGTPPAPPPAPATWHIGPPDRMVDFPTTEIGPSKTDRFRTLVMPFAGDAAQFVRAVEIQPGDVQRVHRATLHIDSTRGHTAYTEINGLPPGNAMPPAGHPLSWLPGKVPLQVDPSMAWTLHPGDALVLILHLRAGEQATSITPRVGFYFSKQTPTYTPLALCMRTSAIDISPGTGHHLVTQSFTIPTDSYLYTLTPHAHHVCRSMIVSVTQPGSTSYRLLNIPAWRLGWQDDYHLAEPHLLPAGSVLAIDYVYDNTNANPNNPFSPPRRITHGPQTTNETARLWLQLLPAQAAKAPVLEEAIARYDLGKADHALAHFNLGKALQRKRSYYQAIQHYRLAVKRQPVFSQAHLALAEILTSTGQYDAALTAAQTSIEQAPDHAAAYAQLGKILLALGYKAEARDAYEITLALDPTHERARAQLHMLNRLIRRP